MSYNVKEARNNLSTIIRLAEKGQPQVIRRHDKEVAVVVSMDEWKKANGASEKSSLLELLRSCPVDLTELDLSRPADFPREIDFGD